MQADNHALVTFFLTGRRGGEALAPVDGLGLRPALFAAYQDLGSLRYDFPLVLVEAGRGAAAVESLSGLFDRALQQAAGGADGESVRKQDLRVEREIRKLVAAGTAGSLSSLMDLAAAHVGRDPGFEDSRRRLRAALGCDGELADCDAALPRRMLRHLWRQAQRAKAQAFGRRLERLVVKLSGLLQADLERSPRSRSAERLAATMGPGFADALDFHAMSRLLLRSLPPARMPTARRQRIRSLLQVLRSQRFFPTGSEVEPYSFEFDSCAAALKAWRERLPKLAALARAVEMGELEVRGDYEPSRHDALFEALDPPAGSALSPYPDYLVCVPLERLEGGENARLMEILSSGLPMKVLLQTDDLAPEPGAEAPGLRPRQLASLAMGLNTAFVLQASASHLLRYRTRIERGLAFAGPALFSVYSGAGGASALPPYLLAAAAMEARVFPAFVYDPGAGANWAARFTLEGNPQAERDWPVQPFGYEDERHQSVARQLAFTAVDLLAADPRHADALARCPRGAFQDALVAVEDALAAGGEGLPERIPEVPMIDAHGRLHTVVVARSLLRQAARCRDLWHSLQELGGIHNSYAEQALARAQREWSERTPPAAREAPATPATADAAAAAPVPTAAAAAAAAPAEEAPEHAPGEPYIETARCSSCNECIQLNPRMFAYDANKQAYIADLNAGTYAQLVEAAENCQVAVIHPGKPRGDEPGLQELLRRAEAFA